MRCVLLCNNKKKEELRKNLLLLLHIYSVLYFMLYTFTAIIDDNAILLGLNLGDKGLIH